MRGTGKLPPVTVVVPAYNEQKHIEKTLQSLKAQDYAGKVELIVVDNNCTDNTAAIAKKYRAIVVSEPHKGVTYARQAGFMAANSEIIACTDADSVVPVSWISKIVAQFKDDPQVVAVTGVFNFYDGSLALKIANYIATYRMFCIFGWYSGANMAVARNAFRASGGFDLNVRVNEDSDLALRLRKYGKVLRLANFKVETSARRFNNLGLIGAVWNYTSTYVKARYLFPNRKSVSFKGGSEVPQLNPFVKLAIHTLVVASVMAAVFGGAFEIKPVRAQVIRREHQIRHQLQHQIERIDIDLPNVPHVHFSSTPQVAKKTYPRSMAQAKVILTFDDGPNPPYTNQILDILKKEGIKATFFVCGANIKMHPQLVKRISKEGHRVGNHTYYHRRLSYLLNKTYEEATQTQKLIDKLVPGNKKLFRFPWGWELPWIKNRLVKDGYQIVPVGIVGNDWQSGITAEIITKKVISQMRSNTIITLHDGAESKEGADRSKTVKATASIIKSLKSQGYLFVSPTELQA